MNSRLYFHIIFIVAILFLFFNITITNYYQDIVEDINFKEDWEELSKEDYDERSEAREKHSVYSKMEALLLIIVIILIYTYYSILKLHKNNKNQRTNKDNYNNLKFSQRSYYYYNPYYYQHPYSSRDNRNHYEAVLVKLIFPLLIGLFISIISASLIIFPEWGITEYIPCILISIVFLIFTLLAAYGYHKKRPATFDLVPYLFIIALCYFILLRLFIVINHMFI